MTSVKWENMNRADVLNITKEYGLAPSKKLGQNFLINDDVINRIIELCQPRGKSVLEIGPGLGAVSRGLAELASSYTAVEIDSGLYAYLSDLFQGRDNVNLIHGDFLKVNVPGSHSTVVSNLPYYCASEILFKIAQGGGARDVFVMVQKEMGERMTALPGSGNYGAMTVNLAFYYNTKMLFSLGGDSFYPKPEVKSSFLHLSRIDRSHDRDFRELFHRVVKSAFWGRRKTLLKSLSETPHLDTTRNKVFEILHACELDTSLRGENLSLHDFIRLTEAFITNDK